MARFRAPVVSPTPAVHCFMPAAEQLTHVELGDRRDKLCLRAFRCVVCLQTTHAVAANQRRAWNVLARQRNKLQGYDEKPPR